MATLKTRVCMRLSDVVVSRRYNVLITAGNWLGYLLPIMLLILCHETDNDKVDYYYN